MRRKSLKVHILKQFVSTSISNRLIKQVLHSKLDFNLISFTLTSNFKNHRSGILHEMSLIGIVSHDKVCN